MLYAHEPTRYQILRYPWGFCACFPNATRRSDFQFRHLGGFQTGLGGTSVTNQIKGDVPVLDPGYIARIRKCIPKPKLPRYHGLD